MAKMKTLLEGEELNMKRSEEVAEKLRNLADMIEEEPDCFEVSLNLNNHYVDSPFETNWKQYEPTGLWDVDIQVKKVGLTEASLLSRLEDYMRDKYREVCVWVSLPSVNKLATELGLTESYIIELVEVSDCLSFLVKVEVETEEELLDMFSPDLIEDQYKNHIRVNYIG